MSLKFVRLRGLKPVWFRGLSVLFFISTLVLAACSEQGNPAPGGPPAVAQMPRLHAGGRDILDEDGNRVMLRGVNLGSWLFVETWISAMDYPLHSRVHVLGEDAGIGAEVDSVLTQVGPGAGEAWLASFRAGLEALIGQEAAGAFLAEVSGYPSIVDDSDLPLRLLLEDRFGTSERDRLLNLFWEAWIREADLAWLAEQGFNLVRVPIGYRSLVTTSDRDPLTALGWNEQAFQRIDALLGWCEKYGIYAVLDIQEAPGGQNDYSGPARLYEDPLMQELTIELWQEISRRYASRNVVAAYSLLAEPFGAPSLQARDDMYDRLVKAIRSRGDHHLLVIHDGFFGMWTLPDPGALGWEGVVYSTHLFEFGVTGLAGYRILSALYDFLFNATQSGQNVPYYIGSFSTMVDEDYAYEGLELLLDVFERSGWSWSLWTYKKIDDPIDAALFGTSTSWGLRGRLASPFQRPDVYRDSRETLATKLSAYGQVVLDPNERLLAILCERTAP